VAINDPEQAMRLCRAILTDIRLYNADALSAGHDLSDVVDEGRALFRSRVGVELHPLFEASLRDPAWQGALARYAEGTDHPALAAVDSVEKRDARHGEQPVPTGLFQGAEAPRERSLTALLVVLLLAWAAAGAWFALR
jgi:hypothetical protein